MEAPAARCEMHDASVELELDRVVDVVIGAASGTVLSLAQCKPAVVRLAVEILEHISHSPITARRQEPLPQI